MKQLFVRISFFLIVLGAAIALVITFYPQVTAAVVPSSEPIASPSSINVAPISTLSSVANSPARAAPANVRAIGNFVSASQATLAFQIAGRVKEIRVKEGERVKAGMLIATLDTSALDAQVAQAQALFALATAARDNPQELNARIAAAQALVNTTKFQVDAARANATTAETLKDAAGGMAIAPQQKVLMNNWYAAQSQLQAVIATNAGAQNSLDILLDMRARPLTLDAQVDAARATLDLAKQNVTNATIVAPFDGTVLWIGPHVGESVVQGAPAATIADLSQMQVQVSVDEISVASIQVGQSATITADALHGKTFTGKVIKIGMLAANTSGIIKLPITIDVDATDTPIAPGLSATVEINSGN